MAKADSIYTFSIDLTTGNDLGTVTGTLDLGFVNPGGTGTGAASSVVFTSIPAGFASPLDGGDDATAWANQVTNTFLVTSGTIASFDFFATTGSADPSDVFCMNSTTNVAGFGSYGCPAGLNELDGPNTNVFGFNFNGLSGVTFTPAGSSAPEPSSMILTSTALLGLAFFARKRIAGAWANGPRASHKNQIA